MKDKNGKLIKSGDLLNHFFNYSIGGEILFSKEAKGEIRLFQDHKFMCDVTHYFQDKNDDLIIVTSQTELVLGYQRLYATRGNNYETNY